MKEIQVGTKQIKIFDNGDILIGDVKQYVYLTKDEVDRVILEVGRLE
jgi:hypothetical protein